MNELRKVLENFADRCNKEGNLGCFVSKEELDQALLAIHSLYMGCVPKMENLKFGRNEAIKEILKNMEKVREG